MGWSYPFRSRSWSDIEANYEELALGSPELKPLLAIVHSIRESGVESSLVGLTSMTDLIVAVAPASSPPIDTIAVRLLGSRHAPSERRVLIEHRSVTGRNDRIERPVEDATRLFWRFVIEKFGIPPARSR